MDIVNAYSWYISSRYLLWRDIKNPLNRLFFFFLNISVCLFVPVILAECRWFWFWVCDGRLSATQLHILELRMLLDNSVHKCVDLSGPHLWRIFICSFAMSARWCFWLFGFSSCFQIGFSNTMPNSHLTPWSWCRENLSSIQRDVVTCSDNNAADTPVAAWNKD